MLKQKTVTDLYKNVVYELLKNDPISGYCVFENRVKFNNLLLGNVELLNYLLDSDISIDWSTLEISDHTKNGNIQYYDVHGLIDNIINKLTKLFGRDSCAIHSLWTYTTPCVSTLLKHPLVCVELNPVLPDTTMIGLPQLLYSILTALGSDKLICLNFEYLDGDSTILLGFATQYVE